MKASQRREIVANSQMGRYIGKGSGKAETIQSYPTTDDTVKFMLANYKRDAWQVKELAPKLSRSTLRATCKAIFDFCYSHFQYAGDPHGIEQIKTPAAAWRLRKEGIDCDDYSYLIMCILHHLKIGFKVRRVDFGSGWQHVYIIVPKTGQTDTSKRANYYVIDPVTDTFDHEAGHDAPVDAAGVKYTAKKFKDDMANTLERLDGLYDDPTEERWEVDEMGNIFKKIGNALKKGVKKVGKGLKKVGKAVVKGVDKTIEFVNRYVNPATILLRNGFLLSMKLNIMNVAKRIRFAYWTDAEAMRKGWDKREFDKLQKARKRMEQVYQQAGGKPENLRKAILKGKGNKDGKVSQNANTPFSSLGSFPGLEQYADEQEYQIVNTPVDQLVQEILPQGKLLPIFVENERGEVVKITGFAGNLEGLGEPATGAIIAAASGAIAAIAQLISNIKGPSEADLQEERFEQTPGVQVPADFQALTYDPSSPPTNFNQRVEESANQPQGGLSPMLPLLAGGAVLGYALYSKSKSKGKGKGKSLNGVVTSYPQEII